MTRYARGLCGAAVAVLAVACALLSGTPSIAAGDGAGATITPTPQAVVTLGRIPRSSTKTGLSLDLEVAGGPRRPVLFDTGSSGFWAYADVLGTQYASTGIPAHTWYDSNIVYDGTVVLAKVAFDDSNRGKLITGVVPLVRVDAASCISGTTCPATVNETNCPSVRAHPPPEAGKAGIACLEEGRKLYGTFGASLATLVEPRTAPSAAGSPKRALLFNLLFGIAPWSTSFIVDRTQLALGPNPQALRDFAFVAVSPRPGALPTSLPNGARPWSLHVTLCYAIGNYLPAPYCLPSLFDTGASSVGFRIDPPFPVPTDASRCRYVVRGLPFSVYAPGGIAIGSFATGNETNADAVRFVKRQPGKIAMVNTGLTFFNRNEMLFDAVKGRIGLRPLAALGDVGTRVCGARSR